MEYGLLVLTVLIAGLRSSLTKIVNRGANSSQMLRTNVCVFGVAFVAIMLMGIKAIPTMFAVPFWLTAVYAVCMVMAQFCLIKAVESGPVSISYLMYSCGLIITLLFGVGYYREKVNAWQMVGVLFVFSSFALSLKKDGRKMNPLWVVWVLGCFLFSGLLGVWQKILGYEYPECKLNNFMQVAFLIMIIFSVLLMLFVGRKRVVQTTTAVAEAQGASKNKWIGIGLVAALGVCMALLNTINTFLAGALPAIVVFPCTGCGAILSSSMFAMLFFKEMPSKMQRISILAGLIGIIFIGVGAAF